MLNQINNLRPEEGAKDTEYINSWDSEKASTPEEVNSDCDNMIEIINKIKTDINFLTDMVIAQPKKANGTFRKGGVQILYKSKFIAQLWEDSYCYALEGLRAKAVTDTTIIISQAIEKEGW